MKLGDIVKTSIVNVVIPVAVIYSATSCAIGEWNPSEWMGTVITDVKQGEQNFYDSFRSDSEPSPSRDTIPAPIEYRI